MNLSPDIITRSCIPPTASQRLRAYQIRMDEWLENAPAQAELVTAIPNSMALTTTAPNNISKFLRKGGAK